MLQLWSDIFNWLVLFIETEKSIFKSLCKYTYFKLNLPCTCPALVLMTRSVCVCWSWCQLKSCPMASRTLVTCTRWPGRLVPSRPQQTCRRPSAGWTRWVMMRHLDAVLQPLKDSRRMNCFINIWCFNFRLSLWKESLRWLIWLQFWGNFPG